MKSLMHSRLIIEEEVQAVVCEGENYLVAKFRCRQHLANFHKHFHKRVLYVEDWLQRTLLLENLRHNVVSFQQEAHHQSEGSLWNERIWTSWDHSLTVSILHLPKAWSKFESWQEWCSISYLASTVQYVMKYQLGTQSGSWWDLQISQSHSQCFQSSSN